MNTKLKLCIKIAISLILVLLLVFNIFSNDTNKNFYKQFQSQFAYDSYNFSLSFNVNLKSKKINKVFCVSGYKNSNNEFKFNLLYDNKTINDFIVYANSKVYLKIQEKYIEIPFVASETLKNKYSDKISTHLQNIFNATTVDFKKEKEKIKDSTKFYFCSSNNEEISHSIIKGQTYVKEHKKEIINDFYNYAQSLNLDKLITEYKQIIKKSFKRLKCFEDTENFILSLLDALDKQIDKITNKKHISNFIDNLISEMDNLSKNISKSECNDTLLFSVQNFKNNSYKNTFKMITENNENSFNISFALMPNKNISIKAPKDNVVLDLGEKINSIVKSYALKNNLKLK